MTRRKKNSKNKDKGRNKSVLENSLTKSDFLGFVSRHISCEYCIKPEKFSNFFVFMLLINFLYSFTKAREFFGIIIIIHVKL